MKNKHIVLAYILCTLYPFAVGFWTGFSDLSDEETYKLLDAPVMQALSILSLLFTIWMAVKVWRTPDTKDIF
jgi:hypothetical protein